MSGSCASPPLSDGDTWTILAGAAPPRTIGRGAAAAATRQTRSTNRDRKRETVAARHRKIANQRRDFHHKQARTLVQAATTCWWWRIYRSPTCCGGPNPSPIRDNPGSSCPTAPGRSPGSIGASVTLAGASSSRSCAPKRKRLGAPGSRSTPGTPPTAAKTVDTQPGKPRHPSGFRCQRARIAPTQTNTPHATSSGLDWPFTAKRREKKLAASSRQRSHCRGYRPVAKRSPAGARITP